MPTPHLPLEPISLNGDRPPRVELTHTKVDIMVVEGPTGQVTFEYSGDRNSPFSKQLQVDYYRATNTIHIAQPFDEATPSPGRGMAARLRSTLTRRASARSGVDLVRPVITIMVPKGTKTNLYDVIGDFESSGVGGSLDGTARGAVKASGVQGLRLFRFGDGDVVLDDVTASVEVEKNGNGVLRLRNIDVESLKVKKGDDGDVEITGHFIDGRVYTHGPGDVEIDAAMRKLIGYSDGDNNCVSVRGKFERGTVQFAQDGLDATLVVAPTGPYESPQQARMRDLAEVADERFATRLGQLVLLHAQRNRFLDEDALRQSPDIFDEACRQMLPGQDGQYLMYQIRTLGDTVAGFERTDDAYARMDLHAHASDTARTVREALEGRGVATVLLQPDRVNPLLLAAVLESEGPPDHLVLAAIGAEATAQYELKTSLAEAQTSPTPPNDLTAVTSVGYTQQFLKTTFLQGFEQAAAADVVEAAAQLSDLAREISDSAAEIADGGVPPRPLRRSGTDATRSTRELSDIPQLPPSPRAPETPGDRSGRSGLDGGIG
jgi:hypothetical protein